MKTIKKISFAIATLTLGMLFSCSNEETEIVAPENLVIEQPSALNKECGFVYNNWSSTASLYTTLPNSGSTTGSSLITTQNSTISSFWGGSAPTFRFVRDLSNPGSTFNAISYGNGKIYFVRLFLNGLTTEIVLT